MSGSAMLDEKHRLALNQFRSTINDILEPHHDDDYLLKWLKARDFDVAKAEKMIRKSFKVRHNLETENILNSDYKIPEVAESYLPTRFWGSDKEGSPVRLFLPGKTDFKGFYRSLTIFELLKFFTYMMEHDLRCARENAKETGQFNSQVVYIMDYKDFDFRQVLDKVVFSKCRVYMAWYQDNYPEHLKTAYLINAPSFLPRILALFKPFIDENTWKKQRIFASDEWQGELLECIDRKIIPKYYGGDLDDPHYDPNVFFATKAMGTIPSTYYVKDELYLKATDPGISVVVIQERHTYSHRIFVQKVRTVLEWVFQTKDYNIKFGVFFQATQDIESKAALKELVKPEFVDSYYIPERGELRCQKVGQYILQFDNSYSWLTKKHLLLRVDVKEPEDELASSCG